MEMKMEDEKVKVRGIYISKIRSLSGATIESLHKMVSEILKQKELNKDGMVQFPNTSENQMILVFIEDEFSIKPFISNRPWFKADKCQLDFHPEEIENLAVLDEMLVKKLENKNTTKKEDNSLILYKEGEVKYIVGSGKLYKYEFNPKDNPFLLLKLFAQDPGEISHAGDIAKNLKKSESEDDRLVRDTMQYIRKKLRLPKDDDIFLVKGGYFGLKKCSVELKS